MVTNETAKCGPYACDGANKTFAITFTFHAAAHIEVRIKHNTTDVVTELTQPAEFSVDNANVLTVAAYSADYSLYILRATPQTQGTDLHSQGPFPAEETERAVDRLTLEVQELKEKLARAALFGPASDEADHELPEPENELFLSWQDGILINTNAFSASSYSIQAFMAVFLESLTKAAARSNLDIDAENTPIDDAGGRFAATEVENALQELAGAGRTVETVKQNQDDIDAAEGDIDDLETGVAALVTDLYNKHEADGDHKDNVIQDQHIDWGAGANQVGAVDVPIADAGGRITATEVENALQELAGVGRTIETIKQNHDDLAGRAARGVVWESTIGYAINNFVSYADKLYRSLQNGNLNKVPDVEPAWWVEFSGGGAGGETIVGCIMMFDGAGWVDDTSMPGWFACIPENVGEGCPNLVDRFVMGKVVAGGGSTGGANSLALAIANLPAHNHGGGTPSGGPSTASTGVQIGSHTHSHTHGAIASAGPSTANTGNQLTSHNHSVTGGSHYHYDLQYSNAGGGTGSNASRPTLQPAANTTKIYRAGATFYTVYHSYSNYHYRWRVGPSNIGGVTVGNQSASHAHSMQSHTHTTTIPAKTSGNQSADHVHSMLSHTHTISIPAQGSGTAFDNRPAYYSMIFIRKCA